MSLYKSCLWPATCTIILAVTAYATTTQATTRQIQAEVKLQQAAVGSPSKPLKYGDKTTKKIPNQEALLLPTSSSIEKFNKSLPAAEKQNLSRNRPRLRAEQRKRDQNQANVQISRRLDIITEQNQLNDVQEVPIVLKNSVLINKQTTTTAAQQRTTIPNRSRTANSAKQTQHQQEPTRYYNLNTESEKDIGKTKDTTAANPNNNSRRRVPVTATTTKPTTNTYQTPLSAHNSNVRRSHRLTGNNVATVRHSHSNQRNNKNNTNHSFNSSNSQPLLTSSNAVAAIGSQAKAESSSNTRRQTGNVSSNQNVSSNSTNNFRSRGRTFSSNASTVTIISSISTPTTTPRPTFQFPSSFNIFTPEFWQFLSPASSPISRSQPTTQPKTTTTTRKPPKKYKPPASLSTKEEKLSLVKQKPTIPPRPTTKLPEFDINNRNSITKKDQGPFRIALPTFNIQSTKRETNDDGEKDKRNVDKETIVLRERFDCPRESEVRFQLFPKICKIDEDCRQWHREEICCEIFGAKSCVSGAPKPLEETSHAPILGVIPRKCPSRPLAELWWEVKECETDMDCWPRVCCPDGRRRYCRTSQPELSTVPVPVQRSFNYLTEYLECTPPPPAIFDLHPKPCTSTLDCFPNVCCQEAGLRHCRPPKKSVLTMLANVFNVDFVKRLTQNIVIK